MIPISGVPPRRAAAGLGFRAASAVVAAAVLGACGETTPTPTAPPTPPPQVAPPPPMATSLGTPCPGIEVAALPPAPSGAFPDHLSVRLNLELSPAAVGVGLDFLGPYTLSDYHNPYMAGRISDWQVERAGELVRHEVTIDWTQELDDSDLRIGFVGDACLGSPVVTCRADRCQLTES